MICQSENLAAVSLPLAASSGLSPVNNMLGAGFAYCKTGAAISRKIHDGERHG